MKQSANQRVSKFLNDFYKQQEETFNKQRLKPINRKKVKIALKKNTNPIGNDVSLALDTKQKQIILFESSYVVKGLGLSIVTVKLEENEWSVK